MFCIYYLIMISCVISFIFYALQLLQGRALLNAIGNLELSGPYAQALEELGHNLEDVARQVSFTDHFII